MFIRLQTHSTTIRGVTYITASYYRRKGSLPERIGRLILQDFLSSEQEQRTEQKEEKTAENMLDFERT